jgi:shikimate dehydrogenase
VAGFPALLASRPDWVGFNVTIPHKSGILPYLDQVDTAAQEVGAVNCIGVRSGRLWGFNTDVYGFERSLRGEFQVENVRQALILGSGGGSKAVAWVLQRKGITCTLISRKPELTGYAGIERLLNKVEMVVNTTPIGMSPNIHERPEFPYFALTPNHFVYDLIYNPDETVFLQLAKQQGCRTCNGLSMLVGQAEKSWEIWGL